MRRLWEDHIAFVRNIVISGLADLGDQDAVAGRLMKNADDIGGSIGPYFGGNASNKLSSLLRDHIKIARNVIQAAKANDQGKFDQAQKNWSANGKQIADYLSSINPNWSQNDLEGMVQKHLDLTTQQINSRVHQDWNADIQAYDNGQYDILRLADTLAEGMVQQPSGMTERRSVSPGPAAVAPSKHHHKQRHHAD